MSIRQEIAAIRYGIEGRLERCKKPDDFLEQAPTISLLCLILDMLIRAEARLLGGEVEVQIGADSDLLDALAGSDYEPDVNPHDFDDDDEEEDDDDDDDDDDDEDEEEW